MSSFRIVMKHIERGNKKWLTVENVDQDKACIICYSNCRNLLLFNCKHLIMCWDCWKLMKHKNCPICKVDISTAKVIYSEEQWYVYRISVNLCIFIYYTFYIKHFDKSLLFLHISIILVVTQSLTFASAFRIISSISHTGNLLELVCNFRANVCDCK